MTQEFTELQKYKLFVRESSIKTYKDGIRRFETYKSPCGAFFFTIEDDKPKSIKCCLPKLLSAHNGIQITTDKQIADAENLLREKIHSCELFECSNLVFTGIKYIEIAWQFQIHPIDLILCHRNAKHSKINKPLEHYDKESIVFAGYKKQLRIKIYDKIKELLKSHGLEVDSSIPISRVEITLRGQKLKESPFYNRSPFDVPISEYYKFYRDILLGFNISHSYCKKAKSLPSIYLFLARADLENRDMDIIEKYISDTNASARTARDIRKKVSIEICNLKQFSWEDYLPESHLPPVHNVRTKG